MARLSIPGFKLLRHIASSTPTEEDLIDGAIYTFSLEYQDRQQNAKAVVNHTDITYAGVDTLAPVFYLPAASSHIPIEFYFDVEILEKALPGTLQLQISYRGGTVDVSNNVPRIIIFSSMFEVAGRHSMLLNNLGDMNISTYPQIASISGSNLVHGSVYELSLIHI